MNFPYEQKQEMNELSKFVFGSTSRWQKLLNKGKVETVTEKVTEYVPGEKEEDDMTTREVDVPVKRNGMILQQVKRYTFDELKIYMLDLKKRKEEIMEQIRKAQEEQRKKKEQADLEKRVNEEIGGSAL